MNTSKNLFKLANHIQMHMPDDKIDMREYCRDDDGKYTKYVSKHDCGTTRCALGESPNVPGLEPLADEYKNQGGQICLDYDIYGPRVYPGLYYFMYVSNRHWTEVFDRRLSSDKESVVKRLLDKSEELAG